MLFRKVLNKNKKIQSSKMEAEEVIKKEATPKLLKTVVQVGLGWIDATIYTTVNRLTLIWIVCFPCMGDISMHLSFPPIKFVY